MSHPNSQRPLLVELEPSSSCNFTTNNVLMHVDSQDITYYLPCYVRFQQKEIDNVDTAEMEAVVSGTLLFSFYYGEIDRKIIELFVGDETKKAILLEFNKDEYVQLKDGKGITMNQDRQAKIIDFVVRKQFRTKLIGNVFLTPFETLDLYICITIQSIHIEAQKLGVFDPQRNPNLNPNLRPGSMIHLKFNCMKTNNLTTIGHGENLQFGHYRVASYFMEASFTNKRTYPFVSIRKMENGFSESVHSKIVKMNKNKKKKGRNNKIGPEKSEAEQLLIFQYAHFRIPIYKYPGVHLLTIFLPMEILGIIGLFVFFQEPGLSGRLATVAVLILAFVALLPTINESIPQTPTIKLMDILIILHLTAILLLGVESYLVKDKLAQTFDFIWFKSGLFITSAIINLVSFLTIVLLFVAHKCIWEPNYQRERQDQHPHKKKSKRIKKKQWGNQECDKIFQPFSQINRLQDRH